MVQASLSGCDWPELRPCGCAGAPGVDWRQKLENQRGAVLATELKNNANKLAKWTAAALVSGADIIKLGYVSRNHPRDNKNHVILGTQARHAPAASRACRASEQTNMLCRWASIGRACAWRSTVREKPRLQSLSARRAQVWIP